MQSQPDGLEVVETLSDARSGEPDPLLVLDRVRDLLDSCDLGQGPLSWERIGDGQSNVTYHLKRDGFDGVLRRGPRPPLPPSTHDMLREARIQQLLAPHGIAVPNIIATCTDTSLLGVPFYVMEHLEGAVITSAFPAALDTVEGRRVITTEVVEALADLHAVDVSVGPLSELGRPDGYLMRQLDRFSRLWDINATRVIPEMHEVGRQLRQSLPNTQRTTVVHGDYRLGNLMFDSRTAASPLAILDWEMATLGDPLSDLGYLTATYTDEDSAATPLHLSPATATTGCLRRDDLVNVYAGRSELVLDSLPWYKALALWKAAVFCEAIYGRWLQGQRPHDTTFAPTLSTGVPALVTAALGSLREL